MSDLPEAQAKQLLQVHSPLDRLIIGLNTVGSLCVLAMVIAVNRDAFGRTFFASPFYGVHELVEFGLVAIVFLQLSDTIRVGRLTRSDGFLNLLQAKSPRAGYRLRGLFDLMSAVLMGLIIYGGWPRFTHAWERGSYAGTQGIFTFPEWPVKLLVVVCAAVTLIKLLSLARFYFFSAGKGGR